MKLVFCIYASNAKVMAMVTTVEEAVKCTRRRSRYSWSTGLRVWRTSLNVPTKYIGRRSYDRNTCISATDCGCYIYSWYRRWWNYAWSRFSGLSCIGAVGGLSSTRFMVARESGTFEAYRDRMFEANETDTVITRSFTGRPARAIRNQFIKEYHKSGKEPLAWPLQALVDMISIDMLKPKV